MLNVKVDRKELLKAIQIVENAVSENKIREVLSGIYIEAKENKVILNGTDLELAINTHIIGEIFSEGKIVIKPKLIEEFLRQISDEFIELVEETGKLIIKTESINTEFALYDAENYPTQTKLETGVEYTFNKNKLLNYIENVKVSASEETANLEMNCIRFEIEENKLKLITSDTYRLTYIEDELEENEKNKEGISVSIPLKTINALIKVMKLIDQEEIILKSDGIKVLFKFKNIEILTRIIELQFPNYKMLLKSVQHDKKILLNTKDFLLVLKRTLIFVRDNKEAKNGGIFNFENNKLFLTGINDNAKIKEELSTIQEGDNLKISLNVKHLVDCISILEGKVTEIRLSGSKNFVIVKDEENEKSLYFTMPLTLREE